LDSHRFEPSKGQVKVLKKMQKYLLNGGNVAMEVRNDEAPVVKMAMDLQETNNAAIPELQVDTLQALSIDTIQEEKPKQQKPVLNRQSGISNLFKTIEQCKQPMKHKLTVRLEPASFSRDAYLLYKKYQMAVHNDKEDELTEKKYVNFLVESPLQPDPSQTHYGSFHQKYYIDDQLIAVAVLDVLPQCVSSVYFLYDPAFGKLSLGTFSALKEIQTVYELSNTFPDLKYYYLGYYIHTCPKMRYKAQYRPSELLCPV
jgi:arginine-tRNA-protein transferase